jgi:hypothetical protein
MFHPKRVLYLGSISILLLAGLLFVAHTQLTPTAHANGCNTVAESYLANGAFWQPNWKNTCTVSETANSDSNAVYGIQLDVNDSGLNDPQTGNHCTVGMVDGEFGGNTKTGVECFQKAWNAVHGFNITVDGIVGPQTWIALSYYVQNFSGVTSGPVWNYFFAGTDGQDFRMWGQAPNKWYVNAGGCWRQMDVNADSCA